MIESIVAMVIVSIVLGSIHYLVQSQTNSLLYNKKLLKNFFITSNAYAELYLKHNINQQSEYQGESSDDSQVVVWMASFKPTMINNINRFILVLDKEKDNSEIKSDFYFYGEIK
jgi:type II secretory pathway pseudopilin PulG